MQTKYLTAAALAAAFAALPLSAPASAISPEEKCHQTWEAADLNHNNVIDVGETVAAGSLNSTKDNWLKKCLAGVEAHTNPDEKAPDRGTTTVPKT